MGKSPECYILRHGQTEWSELGKRTSFTDLPLTKTGQELVKQTRDRLIGRDKLIDPDTIAKVYVSPLLRARETLALLNLPADIPVEITDLLHEFRYGDFEGMKTSEIKQLTGNSKWETWVDSAPGAETPAEVQHRIDELIRKVRLDDHQPCFDVPVTRKNVLLVAHGHILRGYAARWIDLQIQSARSLQLDAGGIGVLGYEHRSIDEPAVTRWNLV